jgi:hypothetical protein
MTIVSMSFKSTWLVLVLITFNHLVLGQINQFLGCTFSYDDCACNNCIIPADEKYCPSSASTSDFECTCQSYDLIFAIYTCLQQSNCNKPLSTYMQSIISICSIDSGYNVKPVISSVEAAVAATMTFGAKSTANYPASSTVTTVYTSANATFTSTFVTSSPTSIQEASSDNNINDGSGLSRSDIIAIGVGLGVGVPSLLIAFITCLKMR